jgi:hypothetical protein
MNYPLIVSVYRNVRRFKVNSSPVRHLKKLTQTLITLCRHPQLSVSPSSSDAGKIVRTSSGLKTTEVMEVVALHCAEGPEFRPKG